MLVVMETVLGIGAHKFWTTNRQPRAVIALLINALSASMPTVMEMNVSLITIRIRRDSIDNMRQMRGKRQDRLGERINGTN